MDFGERPVLVEVSVKVASTSSTFNPGPRRAATVNVPKIDDRSIVFMINAEFKPAPTLTARDQYASVCFGMSVHRTNVHCAYVSSTSNKRLGRHEISSNSRERRVGK